MAVMVFQNIAEWTRRMAARSIRRPALLCFDTRRIRSDQAAHGLRKTRATVLAEGGATASQIAAWTGQKTLAEVEHYTREYDRMKAVMG